MLMFIFIFGLAGASLWIMHRYQQLLQLVTAVDHSSHLLELHLMHRFALYETLFTVVKKELDPEPTCLQEILKLHTKAIQAQTQGKELEHMQAEEQISQLGPQLSQVFERSATLQADPTAQQLQAALLKSENSLTLAKQAYNVSVEQYTTRRQSLLESMMVSLLPEKLLRLFPAWQTTNSTANQPAD